MLNPRCDAVLSLFQETLEIHDNYLIIYQNKELILKGGRPLVLKGTVVKKGDLLVSGVYENALGYYFSNK